MKARYGVSLWVHCLIYILHLSGKVWSVSVSSLSHLYPALVRRGMECLCEFIVSSIPCTCQVSYGVFLWVHCLIYILHLSGEVWSVSVSSLSHLYPALVRQGMECLCEFIVSSISCTCQARYGVSLKVHCLIYILHLSGKLWSVSVSSLPHLYPALVRWAMEWLC